MPEGFLFLFLNAGIVWFVVTVVMMKLCKLKSLVLVLIIAPIVIGSTFRDVAGMAQLIGFYGTSILYGSFGIVGGLLYAEYSKAKAYFSRASKTSFLARGTIALSSLYLLSFFAQKIIIQNPMVEFALGWIEGGNRAAEIASFADYDGALIAGGAIAASIAVLTFNHVRSSRTEPSQNSLEQS